MYTIDVVAIQFPRIHKISLINIEKIFINPITKFYNSHDRNVIRNIIFYKKQYQQMQIKVWKLNVKNRSFCMAFCKVYCYNQTFSWEISNKSLMLQSFYFSTAAFSQIDKFFIGREYQLKDNKNLCKSLPSVE